jgi:hypothetical protein
VICFSANEYRVTKGERKMTWIVTVPFQTTAGREMRTIETNVKDASNAIPQAKGRNPGQEFLWEEAEVKKDDER